MINLKSCISIRSFCCKIMIFFNNIKKILKLKNYIIIYKKIINLHFFITLCIQYVQRIYYSKKLFGGIEKKCIYNYDFFYNITDKLIIFYPKWWFLKFYLNILKYKNALFFLKYYVVIDSVRHKLIIFYESSNFFRIKRKKIILYNFHGNDCKIWSYIKNRIKIFYKISEIYFKGWMLDLEKMLCTFLMNYPNYNSKSTFFYKIIIDELIILNSFTKLYYMISKKISVVLFSLKIKKPFFNLFILLKLKDIEICLLEKFFYFFVEHNLINNLKKKKLYLKNAILINRNQYYKKLFLVRKKLRSRTIFFKKKLFYNSLYLKKKRVLFTKNFKIILFLKKLNKKKIKLQRTLILKKMILIQYFTSSKIFFNFNNKIYKNYSALLMYCINLRSNYKISLTIIVKILIYLLENLSKKIYSKMSRISLKFKFFCKYLNFLQKRYCNNFNRDRSFTNYFIFEYFFNIEKNYESLIQKTLKNYYSKESNCFCLSAFLKICHETKKNSLIKIKLKQENHLEHTMKYNKNQYKKKTLFIKVTDVCKCVFFDRDIFFLQIKLIIYIRETLFFLKNFYYKLFEKIKNFEDK